MLILGCLALVTAIAEPTTAARVESHGGKPVRLVYDLFSWKAEGTSEWQFSILSGLTSHVKTPEEVFDPDKVVTGLRALEQQLAALPDGSDVVWIDGMPSFKRDSETGHVEEGEAILGMEHLRLPPKAIVERVKALARRHKLHLEIGTRGGR